MLGSVDYVCAELGHSCLWSPQSRNGQNQRTYATDLSTVAVLILTLTMSIAGISGWFYLIFSSVHVI
ncbi:hypothetical protein C1H46_038472 [Malus baccata]|uniref:Uncharacterized protein n=1 Tax=Malus baccata TaxID=106549 RepID=A0A540KP46_MALBA|nr:hypothetical protein C1H46_038472 [Malus baccata]